MKRIFSSFLCLSFLLLLFTGCQANDRQLTQVRACLTSLGETGESITIQPNPAYEYTVPVTEALFSVLCLDDWEKASWEADENATLPTMLYFDITGEKSIYRVAVFSDGRNMIQEIGLEDYGFGEAAWYVCNAYPSGEIFNLLVDFVDSANSE